MKIIFKVICVLMWHFAS